MYSSIPKAVVERRGFKPINSGKILLEVVRTHEAQLGRRDDYGQRYTLDFVLEWQDRNITVRSEWIK